MLKITKRSENGTAYLRLEGELNTVTSEDLKKELEGFLTGITKLTIDMEGLAYITSAGLRVLLDIVQTMELQGELKVLHVCEDIMDVFELTGFTKLMDIE